MWYHKKKEAYLREVLHRWLNGPDPSIEDLIRALTECYCEEAAKELERRFAIAGQCTCFACDECACMRFLHICLHAAWGACMCTCGHVQNCDVQTV